MDDMKPLPTASADDERKETGNPPDRLLTTADVAEWLGIKTCTLEKARSTRLGNYPPYIRIGRGVRYRRAEVEAWLRRNSFNVDGSATRPAAG